MKISFLSLRLKGLILAAVLLALELAFVGCYIWLLAKAEAEYARQKQNKEVIARASDLLQTLYDAGNNIGKYAFSRDLSSLRKYEVAKEEIPQQIKWLKQQLHAEPSQLQLLAKIEANINSGLGMLADMKRVSDSEAQLVAMQYAVRLRSKMQTHMESLIRDMMDFLSYEKKIESASPAAQKIEREHIRWLLVAGLLLNSSAAVLLALFFVRSITSRLAVVVDNSARLGQRRALQSPLPGNDEIAMLDRSFHDMSQSLRGEEALIRAGEEQVRAIIDQMPIGLVIVAGEENIEYANPTLEKMLGYKSDALIGTTMSSHFATAGLKSVPLATTSTIQGAVELIARKKDGSQLPVEFSVADLSLAKLSRRLGTVLDVSARHEVQKMRQAFVAMVSHELRTPLTSVAGFLQLLPMGVYGQVTDKALLETGAAEKDVEQLIMLINDLLDLEKLQAGKLEMAKAPLVLEDIIDGAVDDSYALAESLNATVIFEGCQFQVIGDAHRLLQACSKILIGLLHLCSPGAVVNLAVNGDDHTVTIILSTVALDIPEDQLHAVFEPFQQLQLASGRTSLGLALPLARAIVEQHGGRCWAEKTLAGGTSFRLQMPKAPGAVVPNLR